MKKSFLLLAAASLLPSLCAQPYNFIFILTDDQSWRGTSTRMDPAIPQSKSDYFRTPNMDNLFDSGMRFVRGYAPAPYCCPTRRSIQVGQSPARHLYQKDQERWPAVYRQQLTIPRMLKALDPNYITAHFGKWDMRFDEITPEALGYDLSDGYTSNKEGGARRSGGPAAQEDPKLIDTITAKAAALMQLSHEQGRPFFIQLSHYAVHLDIYYKAETLARVQQREPGKIHSVAEFAAMTEDLDAGIGRLMKQLRRLGLEDRTYIIFTSDNGGRTSLPGFNDIRNPNSPLREGKGTMYEGGIRVPFVVVGPGIEQGAVSRVPVSGMDILPTLAGLNGRRLKIGGLDGGNLAPLLRGESETVTRPQDFLVFHQAVRREAQTALMQGDYKIVKTWAEDKLELFNVDTDHREKEDLAASDPERAAAMFAQMEAYLNDVGATTRSKRKRD